MYDLPSDFDLEQFVGKSLELVCSGTYKVDLHLSGGYLIGIEDDISINSDEAVELPKLLELLYPLINQDIINVARSDSGKLSFTFDQGTVLHIHDTSKQFECYSISFKGQTLAIV